jgi:hypothetical protein
MAKMKAGVRSPTAHRTKEQASAQWSGRSPASKAKNKVWKAARADMVKKGAVSPGDGKDVGHKKPLSKGGTNSPGNLQVQSKASNRGHGMSPGGTKKGTTVAKKKGSNPYTKG